MQFRRVVVGDNFRRVLCKVQRVTTTTTCTTSPTVVVLARRLFMTSPQSSPKATAASLKGATPASSQYKKHLEELRFTAINDGNEFARWCDSLILLIETPDRPSISQFIFDAGQKISSQLGEKQGKGSLPTGWLLNPLIDYVQAHPMEREKAVQTLEKLCEGILKDSRSVQVVEAAPQSNTLSSMMEGKLSPQTPHKAPPKKKRRPPGLSVENTRSLLHVIEVELATQLMLHAPSSLSSTDTAEAQREEEAELTVERLLAIVLRAQLRFIAEHDRSMPDACGKLVDLFWTLNGKHPIVRHCASKSELTISSVATHRFLPTYIDFSPIFWYLLPSSTSEDRRTLSSTIFKLESYHTRSPRLSFFRRVVVPFTVVTVRDGVLYNRTVQQILALLMLALATFLYKKLEMRKAQAAEIEREATLSVQAARSGSGTATNSGAVSTGFSQFASSVGED